MAKCGTTRERLGRDEIGRIGPRVLDSAANQEIFMSADSDSTIAWHRAQLKKLRETLKHIETARFTVGEPAQSRKTGKTQKTIAELQRKISQSLQIIAAYERRIRRPLTTDQQTLASQRALERALHGRKLPNAGPRSLLRARRKRPFRARLAILCQCRRLGIAGVAARAMV